MADFKVGDKIRLTNASGMSAEAGALAVVTEELSGACIRVEWDHADGLAHNQQDGRYLPADFVMDAPTDESVAAELRATSLRLIELKSTLKLRGWTVVASQPYGNFSITKSVTQEI